MIVYLDISDRQGVNWPEWLADAGNRLHRDSQKGAMYSIGEPLIFPDAEALRWLDMGDGWRVAMSGGLELSPLLRIRTDLPMIEIHDAKGRPWMTPAVLSPQGTPILPVPLTCIGGQWQRTPTPEQAAMIQAAQAARSEIEAGRIASIPLAAAASWACTLLSAAYHLPPAAIGALGLLDDRLIIRALMSSAGFVEG